MSIAKRIETALKHFANREFENTLLQVCSAIEGTAKKAKLS